MQTHRARGYTAEAVYEVENWTYRAHSTSLSDLPRHAEPSIATRAAESGADFLQHGPHIGLYVFLLEKDVSRGAFGPDAIYQNAARPRRRGERWGLACSPAASTNGAASGRSNGSTLMVCWRFGTLQARTDRRANP